jgi:nucleotide-binding universal stress UspA family protein
VTPPYAHIACCVDDSPAAERALEHARRLWSPPEGRLSIVHVGPRPLLVQEVGGRIVPRPEDLSAAERAWLRRRAAAVPGAEAVFLEGLPGPAVCAWANEAGVDLLVTAAHHGLLDRLLLGSFARHLVNHAPCPVLVVRL